MDDEDIKKALRRIPGDDYPNELKVVTRAEYTTMARQAAKDKKPGCPLMILGMLFRLSIYIGLASLLG